MQKKNLQPGESVSPVCKMGKPTQVGKGSFAHPEAVLTGKRLSTPASSPAPPPYRAKDFADGCLNLEISSPSIHIRTDHIRHGLWREKKHTVAEKVEVYCKPDKHTERQAWHKAPLFQKPISNTGCQSDALGKPIMARELKRQASASWRLCPRRGHRRTTAPPQSCPILCQHYISQINAACVLGLVFFCSICR